MCVCVLSCFSRVQLFATSWTVDCQAPLSMEFSRQQYWSGLPWPSQGDLPDPGNESVSPESPELEADSLPLLVEALLLTAVDRSGWWLLGDGVGVIVTISLRIRPHEVCHID